MAGRRLAVFLLRVEFLSVSQTCLSLDTRSSNASQRTKTTGTHTIIHPNSRPPLNTFSPPTPLLSPQSFDSVTMCTNVSHCLCCFYYLRQLCSQLCLVWIFCDDAFVGDALPPLAPPSTTLPCSIALVLLLFVVLQSCGRNYASTWFLGVCLCVGLCTAL